MHALIEWLYEKTGIKSFYVAIILGLLLFFILLFWEPIIIVRGIEFTIALAPLWLPFFLLRIGWHLWLNYKRSSYIAAQNNVLLEIRIPREVTKSPLAMEAVLAGLHLGPGETTWINRYIEGKVRPWFSLELVSIEGKIHFYIWTRAIIAPRIKSQFYAQFPEVEILEVEDYTRYVSFNIKEHNLWSCEYKLTKPDAYPIKTYIDYGLDKDPKEEFKVDPLAHLMEILGAVGPGEHMWIQLMIRQNKDEKHVPGTIFGKKGLRDEADEIIEEMKKNASTTYTDAITGAERAGFPLFTEGERETMKAIERSVGKLQFDVGIRFMYLATLEKFSLVHIYSGVNAFKQFNSPSLNGFSGSGGDFGFDYPWQEWFGYRTYVKKKQFDAYIRRAYFHYPYKNQPMILNTEELATLYHLPSSTIQTPTVERIASRRGEAPSNLPI